MQHQFFFGHNLFFKTLTYVQLVLNFRICFFGPHSTYCTNIGLKEKCKMFGSFDSSCQKEVSGTPSKVPKSSCQNQQVKISSDEFEGGKKGNFETFWNFLELLRVSQKLLFDNYYAKISTRLFLEK